MSTKKKYKQEGFSSKCIHGIHHENPEKSLEFPIFLTSTFYVKSAEEAEQNFSGKGKGFSYSRFGNPTVALLEERVALLEGGEAALALSSGLAAITSTCLSLLNTGDHLIADEVLYGPTHHFFETIRDKFKIEIDLIDLNNKEKLEKTIKANTKIVFIETPANPNLKITDIKMVSDIVHKANKNIKVICDNTFATPYLQKPLNLGVDIVVHSATKYLNGHGDVIAGLIVASKKDIDYLRLESVKDLTGACLGAFEAFLICRGMKTLELRMEKHYSNAKALAEFLYSHPNVLRVFYPGLSTHPLHEVAKKQMKNFGGILSFEIKGGGEAVKNFIKNLRMVLCAVSLGDPETLVLPPFSTTHSSYSLEERKLFNITEGLIRVSVGLESEEDIINDFKNALES